MEGWRGSEVGGGEGRERWGERRGCRAISVGICGTMCGAISNAICLSLPPSSPPPPPLHPNPPARRSFAQSSRLRPSSPCTTREERAALVGAGTFPHVRWRGGRGTSHVLQRTRETWGLLLTTTMLSASTLLKSPVPPLPEPPPPLREPSPPLFSCDPLHPYLQHPGRHCARACATRSSRRARTACRATNDGTNDFHSCEPQRTTSSFGDQTFREARRAWWPQGRLKRWR